MYEEDVYVSPPIIQKITLMKQIDLSHQNTRTPKKWNLKTH